MAKCLLRAPLDFTWGGLALGDAHIAAARIMECRGEPASRPPLRLHLLHQILLV
jgi:hypothetical protein